MKRLLLLALLLLTSCGTNILPQSEESEKEKLYMVNFNDEVFIKATDLKGMPSKEDTYRYVFRINGSYVCDLTVYDEPNIDYFEISPEDSVFDYESGYKRGQIDAQNDIIKYKRVTTDDGEVIFQKVD